MQWIFLARARSSQLLTYTQWTTARLSVSRKKKLRLKALACLSYLNCKGKCNGKTFLNVFLDTQRQWLWTWDPSYPRRNSLVCSAGRVYHFLGFVLLQQEVWGEANHKGGASTSLGSLFLYLLSPPPWACPMQIRASQQGSMFVSPEVLTQVQGYFLCSLFAGLSLSLSVFWPPPFWTPFSYSNCLTVGKK